MKNIIATLFGALLSAGLVTWFWIRGPKPSRLVDSVSPAEPFPKFIPIIKEPYPVWIIVLTFAICIVVPILTHAFCSILAAGEPKAEKKDYVSYYDGWEHFFTTAFTLSSIPVFLVCFFTFSSSQANIESPERESIVHQWSLERYGVELEDTVFFKDLDSVIDVNGKIYYVELTNNGYILVDRDKEEMSVRL